jgi:hypothetical protein
VIWGQLRWACAQPSCTSSDSLYNFRKLCIGLQSILNYVYAAPMSLQSQRYNNFACTSPFIGSITTSCCTMTGRSMSDCSACSYARCIQKNVCMHAMYTCQRALCRHFRVGAAELCQYYTSNLIFLLPS